MFINPSLAKQPYDGLNGWYVYWETNRPGVPIRGIEPWQRENAYNTYNTTVLYPVPKLLPDCIVRAIKSEILWGKLCL